MFGIQKQTIYNTKIGIIAEMIINEESLSLFSFPLLFKQKINETTIINGIIS